MRINCDGVPLIARRFGCRGDGLYAARSSGDPAYGQYPVDHGKLAASFHERLTIRRAWAICLLSTPSWDTSIRA
ncbi:MAG: hypothetical protein RL885_23085 [Planctomycetota bacterium]